MTLEKTADLYHTEVACVRALYAAKWPDGFRCPRCEHGQAYEITTRRLPLFECKACRAQTSLTAGTILEGTRTPLNKWFKALYHHCTPQGINALQLSQIISVTYKTAWLICHKIRHAMSEAESRNLLTGLVRVIDGVYCKRATTSFVWHQQEQSILIAASENAKGQIERVKIEKQSKQGLHRSYSAPNPHSFIRKNVAREAVRRVIARGRVHPKRNRKLILIGREAEQQLARRFGGIGPKHLQIYMDQFCYCRNRQNQMLFAQLLNDCAHTQTLTYRALIGAIRTDIHRRRRSRILSLQLLGSA